MAAETYPNFKQDLIASVVQRELEFKAKLLPTVTNVSQWAIPGAKSISFPKLSSFSVNDRAFGAADTEQNLTDTVDQILLNQNKIVSWIIDASDDVQTTIGAQAELAKRAASAHARDMDDEIVAVLEADGTATTTAGAISRDIILEMREALFDAEAEEDSLVLVVGNDSETNLLKIDEFTRHDVYGPNEAIRAGRLGTVYGMPVIRRSGLAANTFYMYAKEGIALGMQAGPKMDSQKAIEFGTNSVRYAMDVLYGVDSLQGGALILKDNN